MAPASNEEQFKFLISCIRYSNNGKVDFTQVAKECKIVSKGAAAKRYERMMRAHGIAPNAATVKPATSRISKTERRESNKANEKRKADAFIDDSAITDDYEEFGNFKADPDVEQFHVKEEEEGTAALNGSANFSGFYETDTSYNGMVMGTGEQDYTTTNYSASSASYDTPAQTAYNLQTLSNFDFGAEYGAAGMNGLQRHASQSVHYRQQPMSQFSTESDGGSKSPVIVE